MFRMLNAAKVLTSIPPTVVDLVVAAAVTSFSLTTAADSYPPSGPRPFDALAIAITTAIGAALVVRRRYPLTVMTVCAALVATFQLRGYWLSLNQAGLLLAFYTVASRRGRLWTVAAAAAVYPELLYGNAHEWSSPSFDIYLGTAAVVSVTGIIGDGARRLTESRALMAEYDRRFQRKQRDREQRAVLLERIRIARELHDVTAHHLSVIAVQAGLARFVLDTDAETADRALRTISEVGSEGLAELRRLISLLRPDDEEGAGARTDDRPAPGIAQLPVLIERVGLSGTPSRYTVAGRQCPLPAGIELCVYRVVQESLTNVLKHAPGSSVDVRLEYEPERIRLTVADDGPHVIPPQRTRTPRAAARAAGHSAVKNSGVDRMGAGVGLTGMRERAGLYGGELSAGRKPDGGFEVCLTLPLDAAAPGESGADPGTGPEATAGALDPVASGAGASRKPGRPVE